jgi:hypothetical protein
MDHWKDGRVTHQVGVQKFLSFTYLVPKFNVCVSYCSVQNRFQQLCQLQKLITFELLERGESSLNFSYSAYGQILPRTVPECTFCSAVNFQFRITVFPF